MAMRFAVICPPQMEMRLAVSTWIPGPVFPLMENPTWQWGTVARGHTAAAGGSGYQSWDQGAIAPRMYPQH